MEITEPRRLYQQLAADLKERIEQGVYLVGDKLPEYHGEGIFLFSRRFGDLY